MRCIDWSISRDLLSADICGELPKLLETDAERSTGVPLLSAAESTNNCDARASNSLFYGDAILQVGNSGSRTNCKTVVRSVHPLTLFYVHDG